jgi:hypothetical protein
MVNRLITVNGRAADVSAGTYAGGNDVSPAA